MEAKLNQNDLNIHSPGSSDLNGVQTYCFRNIDTPVSFSYTVQLFTFYVLHIV